MNQNKITPSIGASGANITMSIGEPSIHPQKGVAFVYYKTLSFKGKKLKD
jgi:hypothetical protein